MALFTTITIATAIIMMFGGSGVRSDIILDNTFDSPSSTDVIQSLSRNSSQNQSSIYLVTASKKIRSNSVYHVSVQLLPNATIPEAQFTVSLVNVVSSSSSSQSSSSPSPPSPWSSPSSSSCTHRTTSPNVTTTVIQSAVVMIKPGESKVVPLQIGTLDERGKQRRRSDNNYHKSIYKLVVRGERSPSPNDDNAREMALPAFNVTHEAQLILLPKRWSIFVQTDKVVYKPAQRVQFRVIVVDRQLRPPIGGGGGGDENDTKFTVDIFIKDPKRNLIKPWLALPLNSFGVAESAFALSAEPPLGDWSIEARFNDNNGGNGVDDNESSETKEKLTKHFTVSEYVLPTFSVDIHLPPYATYNRSDVVATVKATYTYGKPVRGVATIMVRPKQQFYYSPNNHRLEQFETKIPLNDATGTVDVPLNLVRDLNLKSQIWEREIEFFASVEELLTGKRYNKTATLSLHSNEFKVDLVQISKHHKPGLRYTAYLKVAHQDDTPVDNGGPPVVVKYGLTSFREETWKEVSRVPVNGLVRLDIDEPPPPPPPEQLSSGEPSFHDHQHYHRSSSMFDYQIYWRATYRDQRYYLNSVPCAQSPSNSFLQVVPKQDFEYKYSNDSTNGSNNMVPTSQTASVNVGEQAHFVASTTEPVTMVHYQVLGKSGGADVLLDNHSTMVRKRSTDRDDGSNNGTNIDITFSVTPEMVPKSRLLVYYIREDNREIVADSLDFSAANIDPATSSSIFRTPVKLGTNLDGDGTTNATTKPGGTVTVNVDTQPNAYVALLGVDQSTLLLGTGNDLSEGMVQQELDSYEQIKNDGGSSYDEGGGNRWFWPRWPSFWGGSGGVSATEVLQNAEILVFTNGFVPKKVQYSHIHTMASAFGLSGASGTVYASPASSVQPFNLESVDNSHRQTVMMQTSTKRVGDPSSSKIVVSKPSAKPTIKLRTKFPETWIWTSLNASETGLAQYTDRIPDTITSWYISAFAMDPRTGLGLARVPAKITVFRPFFLKLSLPYSIIRGETVALQVLVFNYQQKPIKAEVVMMNERDEFAFTSAAAAAAAGPNEIPVDKSKNETSLSTSQSHKVTIPAFDGVSVRFIITPKRLGYIDIKVQATTDVAGDAVLKKLLVKPEGQPQYFNQATLIKLDTPQDDAPKVITKRSIRNFTITVPPQAVPDSTRITVSGISDILGPTVNHIDDLLRMPYGCGEQNMINFVPNIVVLDYLKRVKRLTPSIRSKALSHIEAGYQRELTYRHQDGSFSAFGQSDPAGSTWLTAFVIKSFAQAQPYISIDHEVLEQGVRFLVARQNKDGSFAELAAVHHKALQGGSAVTIVAPSEQNDVVDGASVVDDKEPRPPPATTSEPTSGALTAYVLAAILQQNFVTKSSSNSNTNLEHQPPSLEPSPSSSSSTRFDSSYAQAIQRAEQFITDRLDSITNPYEVAIVTYALHLANSTHRDKAYNRLMSYAKRDGDGLLYWRVIKDDDAAAVDLAKKNPDYSSYASLPNALDVEATAYALMTLSIRAAGGGGGGVQDHDHALATLRWLISKQNSNGGFVSTQDTVIGLQALSSIASQLLSTTSPDTSKKDSLALSVVIESNTATKTNEDTFEFTPQNALVLQQLPLSGDTRQILVSASGTGTAVIQVSYQYNLASKVKRPAFELTVNSNNKSGDDKNENSLQLQICTRYIATNENGGNGNSNSSNSSNMAVIEVELPSGYQADREQLPVPTSLSSSSTSSSPNSRVKRVDTVNDDTKVFVYLDSVNKNDSICITIPAHRVHQVANGKPVPVLIYDYYNVGQQHRVFYEPPTPMSINDLIGDGRSEQ